MHEPRVLAHLVASLAAATSLLGACGGGSSKGGVPDGGTDGAAASGGAGGSSGAAGSAGSAGAGGSGGFVPCVSDNQCTPLGKLCDRLLGICADCLGPADCEADERCIAGSCQKVCRNSLDCQAGLVCESASGRCVQCVRDSDCIDAPRRCSQNECVNACRSDNDCTPQGKLCDFLSGVCYTP